jgi:hypothetical protein
MQQMTWFGESWNAPLNEVCNHQDTPAGMPCLYCEELIEPWASGVMQSAYQVSGWSRRPLHLECFIRMGIGSVGHLMGKCSCYSGTEEDPPGLTIRESARAAVLVLHMYGYSPSRQSGEY